ETLRITARCHGAASRMGHQIHALRFGFLGLRTSTLLIGSRWASDRILMVVGRPWSSATDRWVLLGSHQISDLKGPVSLFYYRSMRLELPDNYSRVEDPPWFQTRHCCRRRSCRLLLPLLPTNLPMIMAVGLDGYDVERDGSDVDLKWVTGFPDLKSIAHGDRCLLPIDLPCRNAVEAAGLEAYWRWVIGSHARLWKDDGALYPVLQRCTENDVHTLM
ncbi:hypothetical protein ACLOJK_004213, partial [Asimina triloba]